MCAIGRSETNQVVLRGRNASRHHAIIQPQSGGEYWLVDFGSTNGTLLNGRRVIRPTLLRDGDQIRIGDESLTFRQSAPEASAEGIPETAVLTEQEIKRVECWLLVADIKGSTQLSNECPEDVLPVVLGRWFSNCRETIEGCGGQINKYLGDGLFAYWTGSGLVDGQVREAVQKLRDAQIRSQPPFRWVLHFGPVSVGGPMSLAEASLLGREVNFTFRMERLAGELKEDRLLSTAAYEKLRLPGAWRQMGPHPLSGFDGFHLFHTF
jgi:adenylate cyclase